jgi:hypothetical protein
MPWYEARPFSPAWGWHWTMNHFDPEQADASGKRSIASHLYPLIGPYDSADPDVLEYHALLMKIAGIDGVIVDWYGFSAFNDYPMIQRRTVALLDTIRRLDLQFALCYEDRTLRALVEQDHIKPASALDQARSDLTQAATAWFRDAAHLRWQGQPLLLVFGPDYLKPPDWQALLPALDPVPGLITLHERKPPAVGSFAWPPMWASKDGVLSGQELDAYLDRFSRQDGLRIAAAFPGFHDIYAQAGTQPSHGFLDPRDGATFRHTLDRALASGAPFIQLVTWNDYGEGTCIEPTREAGYRYLEAVQHARRQTSPSFPYGPDDLRIPARILDQRRRGGAAATHRAAIDAAVADLAAGDPARATRRLDAQGPLPGQP